MKSFASLTALCAIALMLMGAGLATGSDDNEMTVPTPHAQIQDPLPTEVVSLPDGDPQKATVLGSDGRSSIETEFLSGPGVNGVILVGSLTIVLAAGALACIAARRSEFT